MGVIIGIVLGALLLGLVLRLRSQGIKVSWYEWVIGIVGAILLYVGVWHLFASFGELESTAGWLGLAAIGLPALILLAVSWQLIARRQRAS